MKKMLLIEMNEKIEKDMLLMCFLFLEEVTRISASHIVHTKPQQAIRGHPGVSDYRHQSINEE